jgi:glutamate-1-semialdehyde 2,1-aminomutase
MPITITVMSIFFDPHPEKSQALHAWMADEQALFAKHHAASAVLQKRCDRHYLFGMPMHWMQDWPNAHGLFIQSAEHAQLTCVDQLSYADFCLGDTGAMFGHSPTTVAQVLAEQAGQGLTCMLPAQCAAEVGERLTEVFGLPIWQMALSASDANRFVLRWVRAITQRRVVLVFDGCYHGAVDDSLVDLLDSGAVVDRPSALGALHSQAATTRVVPFNDLAALQSALADGQVAAVLAEPALTNCGLVLPHADFWPQAHMLCQKYGSLLVMDETHTVSTALGGWSRQQGLVPDLMVVGKAVAAGLPCAVYGFSHEIAQRMVQAKQQAAPGHSGIGTTLTGNMLCMAAMRATLTAVMTPEAYAHMLPLAHELAKGIRLLFAQRQLPWCVTELGARVEFQFSAQPPHNGSEAGARLDAELEHLIHLGLLNRGVLITPFHNMMLVCPQTTRADVQQLLASLAQVLDGIVMPER